MKVLIVDDNAAVRQVARRMVEAEGHTVVEAADAHEALRAARREDFAIVLCDVYMPGHDGLWLTGELSAIRPDAAVVLMTGAGTVDVAVAGLQAGVVDYVTKPFSREQLSSALQRAVFAHASRRAQAEMERQFQAQQAQLAIAVAELQQSAAFLAVAKDMFRESGQPMPPLLAMA